MSALKRVPPHERFSEVMLQAEGAQRRTALEIRCSRCPRTSHVVKNGGVHVPTEVAANRFTDRGWEVANRASAGKDLCPECKKKPAPVATLTVVEETAQIEPVIEVEPMPTNAPVPAATKPTLVDPPRDPSVAQRRQILDKLEETYNVEEKAYKGDWTDQKIAQKLEMPRAWITSVRDQFFGPEDNMKGRQRYAELEAFLPKIKDVENRHFALATEAEQLYNAVRRALENKG